MAAYAARSERAGGPVGRRAGRRAACRSARASGRRSQNRPVKPDFLEWAVDVPNSPGVGFVARPTVGAAAGCAGPGAADWSSWDPAARAGAPPVPTPRAGPSGSVPAPAGPVGRSPATPTPRSRRRASQSSPASPRSAAASPPSRPRPRRAGGAAPARATRCRPTSNVWMLLCAGSRGAPGLPPRLRSRASDARRACWTGSAASCARRRQRQAIAGRPQPDQAHRPQRQPDHDRRRSTTTRSNSRPRARRGAADHVRPADAAAISTPTGRSSRVSTT